MKDKIIKEMEEIKKRCSGGNSNYYDVLGLDPSTDLGTIKNTINRKYKIYFHPDQGAYIPTEYKDAFNYLRDLQTEMDNVFSTEESKRNYDQTLYQQKDEFEDTVDLNEDTMDLQEEMEKYSYVAMTEEDEDIISALKTTASKYNWNYATKALAQAMSYNNFQAFTRDNGARDKISNIGIDKLNKTIARRLNQDELDSISLEQGVFDYITYAYHNDRTLANEINGFEYACQETYNKVINMGYGNDSAMQQVAGAVGKIMRNSEYDSEMLSDIDFKLFTRDNGARDTLKSSVQRRSDVEFFMRIYLNGKRHENPLYAYDNLSKCDSNQILSMYINEKCLELNEQYTNEDFHR